MKLGLGLATLAGYVKRIRDPQRYDHFKESVPALEQFMQLFHHGENLSSDDSSNNLEDCVVEILSKEDNGKMFSSNGLLITQNGYSLGG